MEYEIEDFFIPNTKGKLVSIGYLVKDLNLIFIGKEYQSGQFKRFQGIDSQTGVFGSNESISNFIKDCSDKYSIILEGAGTTQSHRFRPKFLYENCGYKNITIQYYNYGGEVNHEKYYDRIIYRSGKKPVRDTMWDKEASYTKEVTFSNNEKEELVDKCDVKVFHDFYDSPVEDFGIKFIGIHLGLDIVSIFKEYCETVDYINQNRFENFNDNKSKIDTFVIEPNKIVTENKKEEIQVIEGKKEDFKLKPYSENNKTLIGRYCELNNEHEVSDLKYGMDFREPKYRREVFLRFYEFHLKYYSHPGGVYYIFPYIWNLFDFDIEQKLWWCYINGVTQNPCTTWVIFNQFPIFSEIKKEEFEKWHITNWKLLDYDVDRRYQKGHLVEMWENYFFNLNGKTQKQFFDDICNSGNEFKNFDLLWEVVRNKFFMFGRLSTFSYLEYLKIADINIDCSNLFLFDLEGSKSHRNGISKVLGRDDLDWHKDNDKFIGYTKETMNWLINESELLLNEAKERFKSKQYIKDVSYFTLESTLCCYKSWHRENRRYPNIYNDLLFQRIKKAEKLWGEEDNINFNIFWEIRKFYLPKSLRIEDNIKDPTFIKQSLHPEKQNHYRLTGQVIMMDKEWDCFKNDFNKKYYE